MVRNTRMFGSVVMALFCLAAHAQWCFAQTEMPKEIRQKYPEDKYLIRSGFGDTSDAANKVARFEIVQYFESKITGVTMIDQWAQSQTVRGKTTEQRLTVLKNNIKVSASRDIPGIEIASSKFNRKIESYEAWAVLSKSTYAAVLRDRIKNTDSKVDLALSQGGDNDINRARLLSRTITDLVLREQSRQDLSLLGGGNTVRSRQEDLNNTMAALDSLIDEALDIGVVFQGEVDSKVKAGITKSINDAGFRVKEYRGIDAAVDDGTDMVLSVEHEVSSRTTSKKINQKTFTFFFANGVLSVQAMDSASGSIIDSYVQEAQTNGGDEDQVQVRMLKKILSEQVPSISRWMYQVIYKSDTS